ncbi:MAG TPA: DNA polymerase III subunit beta, partial [Dehalococcoidia bacterium]|nr:DNA polymerase III subunit beta [Dehalococcoidia bacterium]
KGEDSKLTFAASDGFRLAVSDIALGDDQAFPLEDLNLIVPARALREIGRLIGEGAAPVEVRVNEKQTQVQFSLSDVELVAQLIQG